ncbi:hypothetical protein [Catellatospora citrea]|uniref:Uncharacterized protein n=1 Tax=Catellatospora citrea TaxID=53366 RepID=A0A8J3P023_9ACTN|nr:hypothetical protein [Catellatospora citrea]RKE08060.1 hypothetical protein C8E86_2903 [Catellatospora citrea]GIF98441.1 hypothetical protein Cci01nite_35350 [Catellatospora citrea]
MRHIGSFLLALVFAPAIFLLTGTGLSAFQTMWLSGGAPSAVVDTAVAAGALLLASALYAILTMVRLSPVGPFLAGLGMFGMSAWAAGSPESYADTFALLDVHMGGAVGQSGLGLVLALPLLATVVSPRRWRKHERLADETVALQAYPLQQGRPPAPADQTRAFTSVPGETGYTGLPDVPPPSLHYPRATPQGVPTVNVPPAPVAPPQAAAPQAAPPKAAKPKAAPVAAAPPGAAPPLPRRTPATESAVAAASTQPAVAAQATTQPTPPVAPPVAQPAVPPQRSATPPVPTTPAGSHTPAPPPLPEESTVMLTPPDDQQTIKLQKD